MIRGQSVNLFQGAFDKGVRCRFASLLCYDWIGRSSTDGQSVPQQFLEQLNSDWAGDEKKIHWLFLLQHNEKPNVMLHQKRVYLKLHFTRAVPSP